MTLECRAAQQASSQGVICALRGHFLFICIIHSTFPGPSITNSQASKQANKQKRKKNEVVNEDFTVSCFNKLQMDAVGINEQNNLLTVFLTKLIFRFFSNGLVSL